MADKEQKYRLNNPAGPFPAGMILTEAQIVGAGCDFDFWQDTKTLSKATEDDAQVEGAEMLLDDAAMKAEIEARIRNEGKTSKRDQDAIAAEVRRQWDELRDERHERINDELQKSGGGQGKAGAEKPGKVPPRNPGPVTNAHAPAPAVNLGGHKLSDYDGKSDAQIFAMLSGGDDSKREQLKQIRAAQKARDDK